MVLDFLKITPEEWEYKIRNFDFLLVFTSNDFNPFYFAVEFFIDSMFNESGASFGSESVPNDIWMEIFTEDIYGPFWLHWVWTFQPMLEEMTYRIGLGTEAVALPDFLTGNECVGHWFSWIRIPTVEELYSWFIGF